MGTTGSGQCRRAELIAAVSVFYFLLLFAMAACATVAQSCAQGECPMFRSDPVSHRFSFPVAKSVRTGGFFLLQNKKGPLPKNHPCQRTWRLVESAIKMS